MPAPEFSDFDKGGRRAKTRFDLAIMGFCPADCKKYSGKSPIRRVLCYRNPMRMVPDRAVLTVMRHDGLWAVEHEGDYFGHSADKDVARASANKKARQMQDGGTPCLVRVSGEHGFFAGA